MLVQCPRCNTKIDSLAKNGLSYCRLCRKNFLFDKKAFNAYHAQWRQNNPVYYAKVLRNVRTYQSKHPDRVRLSEQKHDRKEKEQLFKIFGKICFICGDDRERKLMFHQIHGQSHLRSYKYVLDNVEDFAYICYSCHHHVHWAMQYLHLSWNQMFPAVQLAILTRD